MAGEGISLTCSLTAQSQLNYASPWTHCGRVGSDPLWTPLLPADSPSPWRQLANLNRVGYPSAQASALLHVGVGAPRGTGAGPPRRDSPREQVLGPLSRTLCRHAGAAVPRAAQAPAAAAGEWRRARTAAPGPDCIVPSQHRVTGSAQSRPFQSPPSNGGFRSGHGRIETREAPHRTVTSAPYRDRVLPSHLRVVVSLPQVRVRVVASRSETSESFDHKLFVQCGRFLCHPPPPRTSCTPPPSDSQRVCKRPSCASGSRQVDSQCSSESRHSRLSNPSRVMQGPAALGVTPCPSAPP